MSDHPPPDEARRELGKKLHGRLLRAVAARKADRSAYYAPSLQHGLTCPDLERSAAATGEDPEAFKAHLRLFDRVFGRLLGFGRPAARAAKSGAAANRQSSRKNRQSSDPDPMPVDARTPRAPKLARALALLMWLPLRLLRTQAIWERWALCYRLHELARWRRR